MPDELNLRRSNFVEGFFFIKGRRRQRKCVGVMPEVEADLLPQELLAPVDRAIRGGVACNANTRVRAI